MAAVTESNKAEWIAWLKNQLDTTNDADYHQTGKNRVFLTQEDDIDIAKYVLQSFLDTLEDNG